MRNHFKIFILLFTLGLFIFPKSMVNATNLDSCCKEMVNKGCCDNDTSKSQDPTQNHHDEKGSCNDCAVCGVCQHTLNNTFLPPLSALVDSKTEMSIHARNFGYITPDFQLIFSSIWQPPKIG